MLSRSALGSPITQLHVALPRAAPGHRDAHRAGRQRPLRAARHGGLLDSLKCIRCGACMNTCPVYRRSGGLSYGATYSGPIGVIIDPTFNLRKYSTLPFASTLNGSCTNVCPVKINIHEQIYKWRQVIAERDQLPFVKKQAMQVAGKVLGEPEALPRRGGGRERGRRAPAALHGLQPASTPGAGSARCRTRRSRPSASGTSRTGASQHEQPRRHPGARAPQPARAAPAAGRAALRRGPAARARARSRRASRAWAARSPSCPRGADLDALVRERFPRRPGDLLGHAGGHRHPRRSAPCAHPPSCRTSTWASCARASASPRPARCC